MTPAAWRKHAGPRDLEPGQSLQSRRDRPRRRSRPGARAARRGHPRGRLLARHAAGDPRSHDRHEYARRLGRHGRCGLDGDRARADARLRGLDLGPPRGPPPADRRSPRAPLHSRSSSGLKCGSRPTACGSSRSIGGRRHERSRRGVESRRSRSSSAARASEPTLVHLTRAQSVPPSTPNGGLARVPGCHARRTPGSGACPTTGRLSRCHRSSVGRARSPGALPLGAIGDYSSTGRCRREARSASW